MIGILWVKNQDGFWFRMRVLVLFYFAGWHAIETAYLYFDFDLEYLLPENNSQRRIQVG